MKKLLTLLFLLTAFISNAQRTMFGGNNNYVAPVAPPIPTGTNPVTNGLILYLDATRSASYAGTGPTWSDLSPQNNAATLVGTPTFSSNPKSLTLDGTGNQHAITSNLINSLSSATFIAWVNPSQIQGTYSGIIYSRATYSGATAPATGMNFFTNNSVGYSWNDVNGTYNWGSGLQTPVDAWSMIAITVSANSVTAYLCNANGIATAVNTNAHSTVTGLKFYIGVEPSVPLTRSFKGKISTAMVYSSALSLSDVTSIFNAQKVAFGIN